MDLWYRSLDAGDSKSGIVEEIVEEMVEGQNHEAATPCRAEQWNSMALLLNKEGREAMATSSEGQGHLQQLANYLNNGLVSFLENLVQINFVDGNNSINKYNFKREALFLLSDNCQVSLIFWWLSLFTVLGNIQHSEQVQNTDYPTLDLDM
ncbi:hypothetical protein BT96DRAFT_951101 [Gymnopus androsaceus JB14]|uniref:Uncharacterized protein n=1 Tax=Gymnopus androsaceus JB14 TaxID=1447944 RepID=A0A6A4GE32_9AGAR|nr:hypothetical protein BT96DRAFT_951101 [Gymnopus androsaceus JB14]